MDPLSMGLSRAAGDKKGVRCQRPERLFKKTKIRHRELCECFSLWWMHHFAFLPVKYVRKYGFSLLCFIVLLCLGRGPVPGG